MLLAWATAVAVVGAPAVDALKTTWSGPDACSQTSFETKLLRYLPPEAATPRRASLDVVVTRPSDSYRLVLSVSVDEQRVTREFEDPDCDALVDAAAFVAAVTIDPAAMDQPPEPNPVAKSEPDVELEDPRTEPQPRSRPDAETEPAIEPARRWYLRLGAGPSGVALPGLGALVEAAAGVRARGWRVGLLALGRTPTEVRSSILPEAGGRLHMWAAGVRGCGVPTAGPVEFPLCASAEAGLITGTGMGFEEARTTRLPWVALGPSAGILWAPHPRVALFAAARVAVPLLRHRFSIGGVGEVYRVGSASVGGVGGVEVRF